MAIDAGRFAVLLLGDSWGKSARSDCASPVGTGWRILGESCEATRIRLFDQLEHISRLNQSLAVCEWRVDQCERSSRSSELHLLSVALGFIIGSLSIFAIRLHRGQEPHSVTRGQPIALGQALSLTRQSLKLAESPAAEESDGDDCEEVARARERARSLQG